MNIFQNNTGQIQVYNFTTSKACYTVNLKFTHDLKHPQGNHYDAITKIPAVSTLNVFADVSDFYGCQHTKKEKLNTIPSSTTVIDLTNDDDGLILPNKSGLHHSNSTTDSLYGEQQISTASVMKHTFQAKPNVQDRTILHKKHSQITLNWTSINPFH